MSSFFLGGCDDELIDKRSMDYRFRIQFLSQGILSLCVKAHMGLRDLLQQIAPSLTDPADVQGIASRKSPHNYLNVQ
jgi:hypothetical protein